MTRPHRTVPASGGFGWCNQLLSSTMPCAVVDIILCFGCLRTTMACNAPQQFTRCMCRARDTHMHAAADGTQQQAHERRHDQLHESVPQVSTWGLFRPAARGQGRVAPSVCESGGYRCRYRRFCHVHVQISKCRRHLRCLGSECPGQPAKHVHTIAAPQDHTITTTSSWRK